jgi:hypothetical protein
MILYFHLFVKKRKEKTPKLYKINDNIAETKKYNAALKSTVFNHLKNNTGFKTYIFDSSNFSNETTCHQLFTYIQNNIV